MSPQWLKDKLRLRAETKLVRKSALFDGAWYLERFPDVEAQHLDPARHYCEFGWTEGRPAGPNFDSSAYLQINADVREAGVNPLFHFEKYGRQENRAIAPAQLGSDYQEPSTTLADRGTTRIHSDEETDPRQSGVRIAELPDQELRIRQEMKVVGQSQLFDGEWYLAKNPDVKRENVDAARHYCEFGWREGRPAGPNFDSVVYLQINADVDEAGVNPLFHYERYGRQENREIGPIRTNSNDQTETHPLPKFDSIKRKSGRQISEHTTNMCQEILNSGFWDEDWYLARYYDEFSEARRANGHYLSPLEYYIKDGWRLGQRPSKTFKLTTRPTIPCNPVEHFLNHLRFEGYHFDENVWIPEDSLVSQYLRQSKERKSRKVVYTCITNNYDRLMQPYCIDPEWDYVCFTDSSTLLPEGYVGVWEIRDIQVDGLGSSRLNRWHKINPHILFPEYEESIYVDGNINIISTYIYDKVRSASTPMLFPRHFARNCAYAEIQTLMDSPRITQKNKALLERQCSIYRKSRFPEHYGLSENNVIYRQHHAEPVVRVMNQWWKSICEHSSRDQASLSYTLWKNNIAIGDLTFPNCRINYKDFWIVKHYGELGDHHTLEVAEKLAPAFSTNKAAIVMSCNQAFVSYLGVVLTSIVENASQSETYDIIVLQTDIQSGTKASITNFFRDHENVSIRFYNMESVLSQLGDLDLHVDGYVPLETYNKVFLYEITSGYERIAYIDTDIVVNSDIAELCQMDLWGKSVGSSANVANIHAAHIGKEIKGRIFRDYLAQELGIEDYNQYFQAGIVVLDMRSERVQNLFSLSVEKLRAIREPVFYDQCIFNSIFYGDVFFFSVTWNHVWYLQNYSYLRRTVGEKQFFDYARSRLDPRIVHFASKDKPTSKSGWTLAEYFWRYAISSPFYQEILDTMDQGVRVEDRVDEIGVSLDKARQPRVLVHLHIYYPDQIDFMAAALEKLNSCEFEICVTASGDFDDVVTRLSGILPDCKFIQVDNRGYDAYPFLKVLHTSNLSTFDYVLKLHTKNARPPDRSDVYGLDIPGHTWRDDLVNALLGSEETFNQNLQLLERDQAVGCVGAKDYIFSTLENNEELNYRLPEWRAIFDIEESTHYVGGTMFLARAFPFERFKREPLKSFDFGATELATGSHKDNAHAFERLFGLVIESEGFTIVGV